MSQPEANCHARTASAVLPAMQPDEQIAGSARQVQDLFRLATSSPRASYHAAEAREIPAAVAPEVDSAQTASRACCGKCRIFRSGCSIGNRTTAACWTQPAHPTPSNGRPTTRSPFILPGLPFGRRRSYAERCRPTRSYHKFRKTHDFCHAGGIVMRKRLLCRMIKRGNGRRQVSHSWPFGYLSAREQSMAEYHHRVGVCNMHKVSSRTTKGLAVADALATRLPGRGRHGRTGARRAGQRHGGRHHSPSDPQNSLALAGPSQLLAVVKLAMKLLRPTRPLSRPTRRRSQLGRMGTTAVLVVEQDNRITWPASATAGLT